MSVTEILTIWRLPLMLGGLFGRNDKGSLSPEEQLKQEVTLFLQASLVMILNKKEITLKQCYLLITQLERMSGNSDHTISAFQLCDFISLIETQTTYADYLSETRMLQDGDLKSKKRVITNLFCLILDNMSEADQRISYISFLYQNLRNEESDAYLLLLPAAKKQYQNLNLPVGFNEQSEPFKIVRDAVERTRFKHHR